MSYHPFLCTNYKGKEEETGWTQKTEDRIGSMKSETISIFHYLKVMGISIGLFDSFGYTLHFITCELKHVA